MAKFRLKKKFDVMQVVKNLVKAILSLYVGGTIIIQLGLVMNQTESPFYLGLKLIGWTVGNYPNNGVNWSTTCAPASGTMTETAATGGACITSTTGSGGILAVVGIIAIASIVLQFVEFSW